MRKAVVPACLVAAFCALPAAAAAQGGGEPPLASQFEKVTLNDRPGEPMSLAVLPDRRVLHTARTGEVRLYDPRTGLNTLAAEVDVYQHDEEGLQGIAVDPNFERQPLGLPLLLAARATRPVDDPSTPVVNEGDAPFTGTPADFARVPGRTCGSRASSSPGGELDLDTEQKIIDVPVDRGICCHVGGQIDFDGQGNLYLSTGDDSNPFFSDGFAPIDERPNRNPAFDAQRTSGEHERPARQAAADPSDEPTAATAIPGGNLFRPGTPKTKPEIYAMGLRNPFRFAVNRVNGDVYMADYSPDAPDGEPGARPGGPRPLDAHPPAGQLRLAVLRHARPAVRRVRLRDRAVRGSRSTARGRENDSPRNTGQRFLPAVVQPDVWYSYPAADEGLFPELLEIRGGDGIGPAGGPAYQFDRGNPSAFKWPRYYNGQPLFYEWTRDYVKEFRLNRPNGNRLADIRHVPLPLGADHSARAAAAASTTRWTWSSAPTACSTSSSTATGSSARTRRRSSRSSTSCAATARRSRRSRS